MLQVGHLCGLCNRLDVIATGYVLAALRGENEIEVLWPLNERHMPVRFDDLFTALPGGRVVEQEIDPVVARAYQAGEASLAVDYRNDGIYRAMLGRLLDNAVLEVQSEVAAFTGRHFVDKAAAGTTVGVHVRRSEQPLPICNFAQPLRFYEAVMNTFPAETRFFISTDSQEAFRWLQARFGSRVFQREKVHDDRSTVAGVREGLVDMLLLSRCSAIVGTYGSSFSAIAAHAGQRPILLLKAFPDIAAGWPHFSRWRWIWAYRHFLLESTIWQRSFEWSIRPHVARIPRIPARALQVARTYLRNRQRLRADHTTTSSK